MNWAAISAIVGLILVIIAGIAALTGQLEQTADFFRKLVMPMFKQRWIREGTYPLKVSIRNAQVYGLNNPTMTPQVLVTFLVEPRKAVILGECEMIPFPRSEFAGRPDTKSYHDERAQDWEVGKELGKARTFNLNFIYAPEPINEIQIQIEAEGYCCKSNRFRIP